MTIAPVHADGNIALRADGRLEGRARRVPFARHARHIAVLVRPAAGRAVALVATSDLRIRQDRSLAGEPRDNVAFDGAVPEAVGAAAIDEDAIQRFGAAVRLQQIAGALEKIIEQSVEYALDRVQFGRPIAKFQAVQHNLATLAGEVAAASAAADLAAEACAARRARCRRDRDRQGARRRSRRHRGGDRASGAWRDGLYLRALAAPPDAPVVELARRIRQRDGMGDAPRPDGCGRRAPTGFGPSSPSAVERERPGGTR